MTGLSLLVLLFIIVFGSLNSNLISATQDNLNSNSTKPLNNTNFNVSSLVYGVDSKPFNTSYSDWTAKWWQWAYSIPWERNPSYDDTGKYCSENQKGPVWFLTTAFEHPVARTCEIPKDTALLITLLNSECSYAEFKSLKSEQELRNCAKSMQNIVSGGNASLDGVNIPNLEKYRIQTNLFNFTLPQNNILNLTSQTTQSVADGNWLFLKPLPPGVHKLTVKGDINKTNLKTESDKFQFNGPVGWNQSTTYILKIN
jgi:hypothetical protein